jgi:phosphatidylglycerophosphate synthase
MIEKPRSSPPPVQRIQQNVLASSERHLLTWLCGRMPAWITPDKLTSFGMIGAVAIFAGYAASGQDPEWLWLAIVGYAVQWFGDSMDGSLARYRSIERPSYGYFIDHSCDGIATMLILAGIGFSPFVRLDVALFAMAGYLLLSIHAYLSARVIGDFKLSYLAAGPTELRLMLFLGTAPGAFGHISGFDLFVGGVGTVLLVLFLIQTLRTARQLALIDR